MLQANSALELYNTHYYAHFRTGGLTVGSASKFFSAPIIFALTSVFDRPALAEFDADEAQGDLQGCFYIYDNSVTVSSNSQNDGK